MNDVYPHKINCIKHSLRYIHIITQNVVGILNRISSLMRRKRYNMEEVSVSFDNNNQAHIIIAIDGEILDIEQVIHQIEKLHDVKEVYDASHKKDLFFNGVYVQADSSEDIKDFPIQPVKILDREKGINAVFIVSVDESPKFYEFLEQNNFSYIHRITSLI